MKTNRVEQHRIKKNHKFFPIIDDLCWKSKNMYYYGTDVIGTSLEDAIATLDDKKNNDLRLGIMSGIEEK